MEDLRKFGKNRLSEAKLLIKLKESDIGHDYALFSGSNVLYFYRCKIADR